MVHKERVFCAMIFFHAVSVLAQEPSKGSNCWVDAGTKYRIDPWILYAIAEQESSLNPLAVNKNRDNSRDVGIMQINSFWFDKLKNFGILEKNLFDPCTNIHVGAWVLSQSIQSFGSNWRAVGAYNAGTGKNEEREILRKKYADRIYQRYIRLTRRMQ
jgi:soluble lytic murein transglycosylase-like protein